MKPNFKKMIEWLAVVLRCPVCANRYSPDQTHIIENRISAVEDPSSFLVHSDCEKCRSSVIFNITMDGPEMFSVGMVTDLTPEDISRLGEEAKIDTDDVIEFYNQMKGFDGDFTKALRE